MTLRLAAAMSVFIGIATFLVYLQLLGKGPLANPVSRHLRAGKDRGTSPPAASPIDHPAMFLLPRRAPLATIGPIEARGVTLEGYVQRIRHAVDNDFHLDVAAEPRGPDGAPQPYAVAEITPRWRAGSSNWGYERLLATLRPNRGGATPWDQGPSRVRFTGWLLYDYQHEHRLPRPGRPVAVAAWELHPVTRIELWSDSLGRYMEYPR